MDLYCPKCGDPVENDYLHDVVEDRRSEGKFDYTYSNALAAFQNQGCDGIDLTCNPDGNRFRAQVSDAMFDLMGDDADGVANMMEDFDHMF